ncbi:SDR family NAD(P)-dependent oxidoreductase [Poritiphilus flavus]|uniref:SDR family NAD(P)-dependent oxidoreductase n=1 Tax=Poritiphilus flavus TaxID=2697053 RepID=A0A6L9E9S7_9FLAO|nr:SDR family NAD(P)-dependent oxidoreductase [Poritiphilus flavus]NAS11547.1 SDR family NAD(P)-dependent oxidoreductase [Poritiphilus flavus]
MQTDWKNKTAIITGAAKGLGLALAERLLGYGARVAMFDRELETLEKSTKDNPNGYSYEVDVVDYDQVKKAVDHFATEVGRIDILVNCAGIVGKTNIKSHEVATADFENVMAVNVLGSFHTFKAVAPYMLDQGHGRVLHVASISGKDGNAGMLAYSTSKAAVIGMTKVQGKEYAQSGILINAIAPAVIRTAILDGMAPEQVKYMTDKIPMDRCGTLDEFVEMASFIVSDQNSFTTGFTYDLSGGRALY